MSDDAVRIAVTFCIIVGIIASLALASEAWRWLP